jgi:hypothetical protein
MDSGGVAHEAFLLVIFGCTGDVLERLLLVALRFVPETDVEVSEKEAETTL